MINSEYIINEQIPLVEEYLNLRSAVKWGNPSPNAAEQALNGSLLCVCVRHNGELVGFGRVVGDGGFSFYIQDMIVHPDHQGKGLGRAVMNRIMEYIVETGGEEAYIGLMAAKDKAGFYEKFGFSVRPEDAPGMQIFPKFRQR